MLDFPVVIVITPTFNHVKNIFECIGSVFFYIGFRNPVWRMRAIIGTVFSLTRKDVESLSKLLGQDSYKKT